MKTTVWVELLCPVFPSESLSFLEPPKVMAHTTRALILFSQHRKLVQQVNQTEVWSMRLWAEKLVIRVLPLSQRRIWLVGEGIHIYEIEDFRYWIWEVLIKMWPIVPAASSLYHYFLALVCAMPGVLKCPPPPPMFPRWPENRPHPEKATWLNLG